jgi:hypothetical protein
MLGHQVERWLVEFLAAKIGPDFVSVGAQRSHDFWIGNLRVLGVHLGTAQPELDTSSDGSPHQLGAGSGARGRVPAFWLRVD